MKIASRNTPKGYSGIAATTTCVIITITNTNNSVKTSTWPGMINAENVVQGFVAAVTTESHHDRQNETRVKATFRIRPCI